ncbi:hypothetical protein [Kibdelosporangium persicum]
MLSSWLQDVAAEQLDDGTVPFPTALPRRVGSST